MLFADETVGLLEKAINFGLPTFLLVLMVIGLFWTARWLKSKLIEPMVASHINLVNALKDTVPDITTELKKQTDSLHEIKGQNQELVKAIRTNGEKIDDACAYRTQSEAYIKHLEGK